MSLPVLAIVGRPNVGKSTLFNRFIGFRKSVVDDRPGVTRDRIYEEAEFAERRFWVIDTGGLEPVPDTDLLQAMRTQSLVALEEADVILFVLDGRQGITPADHEVSDLLRRARKPVVLVVNKIDGPSHDDLVAEFWQLGFDAVFSVSAAHGRGVYELLDDVVGRFPPVPEEFLPEDLESLEDPESDSEIGAVRIAVIGRPNIGKSTLVNRLLGEERHLVHDSPGTTMDSVDSPLEVDGRKYVLVDTAGVRKKGRIGDQLERFVTLRSIKSIERCHVCLLVIDAVQGPTEQDARLADLVIGRGRGLIVLFNKWDRVKEIEDVNARSVEEAFVERLPHASWAPQLFISAKTGKGTHRILSAVDEVFQNFNRRVKTPDLNRFLDWVLQAHSPPQRHHRPVRIHYAVQARVRPPTFVFFCNTPEGIKAPYQRYLGNRLRESFDFEGTPLRLHFRRRRKPGEDA